jgi:hypothetical protein
MQVQESSQDRGEATLAVLHQASYLGKVGQGVPRRQLRETVASESREFYGQRNDYTMLPSVAVVL